MSKTITFITGNDKKLIELTSILGANFPRKIITHKMDLPEIQGDIDEICTMKCLEAGKLVKGPVLVEDTSLCFNALQGLPGPYIKWFLKLEPHGLAKLLNGFDNKSAVAICTFGYNDGNGNIQLFQGKTEGDIVDPRGPNYFGWDPIFQPKGYDKTYAELPSAVKNTISHRCKAIEQMKEYFANECSVVGNEK